MSQQLLAFTSQGAPFSDFTIKVLDKESDQELASIPVQKAILASASPVFRIRIYEMDMKEKRDQTMVLRDWSVAAVRGMVHFLFGAIHCSFLSNFGTSNYRALYSF
jgi:hypothetical protein